MGEKPTFEIIEDQPEKPKRKRKQRPLFGNMPWRWIATAFLSGIIVMSGLVAILMPTAQPSPNPTAIVGNETAVPTPTIGEYILDIAHDGNEMAIATISGLRLYKDDRFIYVLEAYEPTEYPVYVSLDFSPYEHKLASLRTGLTQVFDPQAILSVWNTNTGSLQRSFVAHQDVGADGIYQRSLVTYSPDRRWIISGVDVGATKIWDASTFGIVSNILSNGMRDLVFAEDMQSVVFVNNGISIPSGFSVSDISDLSLPRLSFSHDLEPRSAALATISSDGRYVAYPSGTDMNVVEIYDTQTAELARILNIEDGGQIEGLAFSPTEDRIAVVHRLMEQVSIRLYDWQTITINQVAILEGLPNVGIYEFSFLDNQQVEYVSAADNNLYRWNIETGIVTQISL